MRKYLVLFLILLLIFPALAFAKKRYSQKGKLYLAYNVWVTPKERNQAFINYKWGDNIIPAGTEVYKAKVEGFDDNGEFSPLSKVSFKIKTTGQKIRIKFNHKWHPGQKIYDYYKRTFTRKTFEELTKGFSEVELKAIRDGALYPGMSKEAVIVSYGYPPEHMTPNLDSNEWFYWISKLVKKKFCFDENNKTIKCPGLEDL